MFKCREHKKKILNLVDIYVGPNDVEDVPKIIHHVEDLMEVQGIHEPIKHVEEKIVNKNIMEDVASGKRWRKITGNICLYFY